MSESPNQFKKAPKRKAEKGRRVTVSPEVRQAYADLITEREKRDKEYARHLPSSETKGR